MPEEDFFQQLDDIGQERTRIVFYRDRRAVLTFTVQYETSIDDQFFPVVRYDSAHDRPHRDVLDRSGRLVRKEWLPDMDYNVALDFAIADIEENWRAYRRRFTGMPS